MTLFESPPERGDRNEAIGAADDKQERITPTGPEKRR